MIAKNVITFHFLVMVLATSPKRVNDQNICDPPAKNQSEVVLLIT
jgi:hypothetical protein